VKSSIRWITKRKASQSLGRLDGLASVLPVAPHGFLGQ
jgi:hypothetical protein